MKRRTPAPKADRERARRAGKYADELLEATWGGAATDARRERHGGYATHNYAYALIEDIRAAADAAEVAADAFEETGQVRPLEKYRERANDLRKTLVMHERYASWKAYDTGTPRRDPPARRRTSDRARSTEGNENLAYLLDRDVRAIGPESAAAPPARDVRLLISSSGSYRYVGLENGRPVSALQILSRDGGVRGVIANVYTTPFARRRGWARRLLEVARKRFREVKHSSDLTPAGEAWKNVVRDFDYRGQKVPFDFARAAFDARQDRPGALEVLRDGIEEWFPRQYADAVKDAEHHWTETRMPYVVLFNARVARARFRRWQDARSTMRSPFDIQTAASIARNGMPPYSAIIWPRELVKRTNARGN